MSAHKNNPDESTVVTSEDERSSLELFDEEDFHSFDYDDRYDDTRFDRENK